MFSQGYRCKKCGTQAAKMSVVNELGFEKTVGVVTLCDCLSPGHCMMSAVTLDGKVSVTSLELGEHLKELGVI